MSPIGDAFRNRLRMFPSLINCCTIDWFHVGGCGCGCGWVWMWVWVVVGGGRWRWVGLCFCNELPFFSPSDHITTQTPQSWPEDALEMVANKFFEDIELEDGVLEQTVLMCKQFHVDVESLSQAFLEELRRHNYVTPTSYLELILTFKKLLNEKRQSIELLQLRWLMLLQLTPQTSLHHEYRHNFTTTPPQTTIGTRRV